MNIPKRTFSGSQLNQRVLVMYRGWFRVPVQGHVLEHVPRQVLGRHMPDHVLEHMLEHMPGHVLEHMPGHVPRHLLKHVPEYVLQYVPKHVLRHMLDKHLLEHVLTRMAHAVLMT